MGPAEVVTELFKISSLLGPRLGQELEDVESEALKKEWWTERKWDWYFETRHSLDVTR